MTPASYGHSNQRWLARKEDVPYTGPKVSRADPDAPGRIAFGYSSPVPEDYVEAGSLWEHLARNRITFRNYGGGLFGPGVLEGPDFGPTGMRNSLNVPIPEALFENTSH